MRKFLLITLAGVGLVTGVFYLYVKFTLPAEINITKLSRAEEIYLYQTGRPDNLPAPRIFLTSLARQSLLTTEDEILDCMLEIPPVVQKLSVKPDFVTAAADCAVNIHAEKIFSGDYRLY